MRTARVVGDSTGLDRSNRETHRVVREVERTQERQSRILNPLGPTSGGGGRGGFKGALKDFVQRDEILGRTGTISRLAHSGNVVGTLLAFQSIEEFFASAARFLKGDASFADGIRDQLKFLVPSIAREQIPAILEALGVIEGTKATAKKLGDDYIKAINEPDRWTIDPGTGKRIMARPAWLNPDTGQWGELKWRQTENWRRLLSEANSDGLR